MKAAEIKQLSNEEIAVKLRENEEELFKLRFQKHTGRLENTSKLGLAKRVIARLKTEVNNRQKTA